MKAPTAPSDPGVARWACQRWWWSVSGSGSAGSGGSAPSHTSMPAPSADPAGLADDRCREDVEEVGRQPVEEGARPAALAEHEQPRDGVDVVGRQPGPGEEEAAQLAEEPGADRRPKSQEGVTVRRLLPVGRAGA